MDKARVIVLLPRLSGHGGTETVVNEWIRQSNDNFFGDEFIVQYVAATGTDSENWHVASKYYIWNDVRNNHFIRQIQGTLFLSRFLKSSNPDIVIVLSTKLLQIAKMVRDIFHLKYKIVTWLHFSLRNGTGFDLSKIHLADSHLCISSGIKEELHDLGVDDSRIFMIGNPVKPNKPIIRNNDGKAHFYYVGRLMLTGQKNLKEMFLGLANLNLDWQLDLIGDGSKSEIKSIESFIQQLNIGKRVNLRGWSASPWDLVINPTAIWLTSKYEGFGMTLAEACARGIPCISSDCPVGPRDIITNGVNGFLYPPGDIDRLSKALNKIVIEKDSFGYSTIANSIKKYYPKQYFRNLKNVFKNILG